MIEGTGDRTNSEMDIIRAFFENQVLKLEVSTLTKDDIRLGTQYGGNNVYLSLGS